MFERPRHGERAVLLFVGLGQRVTEEDQQEFNALALSAGADIVATVSSARQVASSRYLIGSGKLEELQAVVEETDADLVLVDHELSPRQQKNLEAFLKRRVVDRAGLILDIFALRARTHEGKLQVELAQLTHLSTRLVRGWTHLERQKGGIGLRGPGETQLESDRRMIGQAIKRLHRRLERVEKRRQQGRQQRRKQEIPTISLVGYTNAGKSTLFNRVCNAGVHVADQLFATLDPTLRKLDIPDRGAVILADTVGFVRDLPHELIAAFKSTLEETRDARLLLHVTDCADPAHMQHIEQVEAVLQNVGADGLPVIHIYNKADILGVKPRIDRAETGMPVRVWLSAETGEGVNLLLSAISEYLFQDRVRGTIKLGVAEARLRALVYSTGQILDEQPLEDGGWQLQVEFERRDYEQLRSREELRFYEDPEHQPVVAGINAV
ncbi:MAG: GTPase HflX [Gammaproteobacteria bacterium]|nr:GTPase HflX [Gammaproteobacteria bacterium]MCP4091116.1 GTPase HflX [Gammaproteobacteria bacterium]MCP4277358.1 GTPase HflX [Gammaproteobacteria bacterium]MCP4831581.1 GTPase HflX [Gammaproteobacteria bacterium]MCP4927804.1 GTPase HflX [Gammaproteobacteria bacterium]